MALDRKGREPPALNWTGRTGTALEGNGRERTGEDWSGSTGSRGKDRHGEDLTGRNWTGKVWQESLTEGATMAVYKPAPGAQYGEKEAQALGQVLEKLGFAKPAQIVDAARPKKSPIHGLFEWDNSVAAEKYRMEQAREHTNHLEIVITNDSGEQRVKAFHSVIIRSGDDEAERGYSHMKSVASSPELVDQVIAKALAELNGWRHRYAEYKAVFGRVFAAIADVEATTNGQKKRPAKRREKAVA